MQAFLRLRAATRRTANRPRPRDDERGQILVLFTLAIVLLMALAAVVIDVSLLRNDGGKLQNALDAGALAAAHSLPVDKTNAATVSTSARDYTRKNYPGMPGSLVSDPITKYACLVGVDAAGLPRITDMPEVCNVTTGSATAVPGTPLPANNAAWRCTTAVCWAPCDPITRPNEICNTIILTDNVTRPYTFGRAVGVNSGNSGVITSAACSGLCGNLPAAPVDVVLLLDRTGSMDDSNSVDNLRAGAFSVLTAFDPELQRIALGFTGPSSETLTSGGYYGQRSSSRPINACTPGGQYTNTVHAIAMDPERRLPGATPNYVAAYQAANASNGQDDAISVARPTGGNRVNTGDFLLATIAVDDGSNANVSTPNGWQSLGRTNNGSNVGIATFYKFATNTDTQNGNWTWNLTNNTRAAAVVVRYTGVNTSDPFDDAVGNTNNNNNSTVTTDPIQTSAANRALVGVFVANTRNTGTGGATQNFTMTGGSAALTERADIANTGSNDGPSIAVGTGAQVAAGNTGSRTATAANSTRWASQLIALQPPPGAPLDTYPGNAYPGDLDQWMAVKFTGLDNDAPAVAHHQAYVDANKNPVRSTAIVQAIGCFDVSQVGTNLATPLDLARQYLQDKGRPGVKKGIILETDGQPEHNPGQEGVGDWRTWATCRDSNRAANAVKDAGIELFTIGYGIDGQNCPDGGLGAARQLAGMATDSAVVNNFNCNNTSQRNTENTDGDHFFCAPEGGDLADVLHAAAVQLAGKSRLVQLYPTPIVSSVQSPAFAGETITITGKYFTEAYAVTFGGTNSPAFTVVSDTTITARVPPGTSGATVDVQVSTPGGSSKITSGSRFTYR